MPPSGKFDFDETREISMQVVAIRDVLANERRADALERIATSNERAAQAFEQIAFALRAQTE